MGPHTAVYTTVVLQLISTTASQLLPPFPFPYPPGLSQGAPTNGFAPREAMQMPAGAQMPFPMQQPRMPVVVMPYHSKNRSKRPQTKRTKKIGRRPKKYMHEDSSSDSYSESSSSELRATRRSKKAQVLTPVVSYVTKDGYVVYQKKIKRERARDWLELGRKKSSNLQESNERYDVSENTSNTRFNKGRDHDY